MEARLGHIGGTWDASDVPRAARGDRAIPVGDPGAECTQVHVG